MFLMFPYDSLQLFHQNIINCLKRVPSYKFQCSMVATCAVSCLTLSDDGIASTFLLGPRHRKALLDAMRFLLNKRSCNKSQQLRVCKFARICFGRRVQMFLLYRLEQKHLVVCGIHRLEQKHIVVCGIQGWELSSFSEEKNTKTYYMNMRLVIATQ